MDDTSSNVAFAALGIIGILIYFGIILAIFVFWAIGNAALARRLGKSAGLWAILTLIPGINFIFMYYVMYQTIYGILDRLPAEPLRRG